MENLPQRLKDQYERERKLLPSDEGIPSTLINYTDTMQGYYFMIDYFENIGSGEKLFFGLGNPHLLASTIGRQFASYGGVSKWDDPVDVSASLFYGLVKNHAFVDGNKRVALLMLLKSLLRSKRVANAPQSLFENLTVAVAGNFLERDFPKYYNEFKGSDDLEIKVISRFLRKYTRQTKKEFRSITYRELKTILNHNGFDLADPYRNYITIYRVRKKTGWLSFGKPKEIRDKLGTMGFPAWTKQVSKDAVEYVRELTDLTDEFGYDSEVFYGGSEPVYKLIHDFEEPLKRLKDK